MTLKDAGLVAGVLIAIFIAIAGLPNPSVETVREVVKEYGAAPGPDRLWECESVNGVETCFRAAALNTATTTACSLKSPAATSTLSLGSGIRLNTSSTTAVVWRASKAATPSTATTFLFGGSVAANGSGTIVATTSADTFVFAPNTWLNIIGTGGTGTYSPVGKCAATFEVI